VFAVLGGGIAMFYPNTFSQIQVSSSPRRNIRSIIKAAGIRARINIFLDIYSRNVNYILFSDNIFQNTHKNSLIIKQLKGNEFNS